MLDGAERFFEGLDLSGHDFSLFENHGAALCEGFVAAFAQFDVLFDVVQRHARRFEAAQDANPAQICICVAAPAVDAVHFGNEALAIVKPQGVDAESGLFGDLRNRVIHIVLRCRRHP